MSDQLMTTRRQHRERAGGNVTHPETERPGEEVMPGIYTCVYVHAHTIQTLRDAAWTLTPRTDVENSLPTTLTTPRHVVL